MPVETLHCPMCGAAVAADAAQCDHCGARLATVSCPSCFGMIFKGAKFCSHCGARVEQPDIKDAEAGACPRCNVGMNTVTLGNVTLQECPTCQGLWVDTVTLEQICVERERQAAVLGMGQPATSPVRAIEEKIRYLPCPVCRKLMNRVNFAHYSNVIVDVCKAHGTWFDRDELRKVIEFIRAGGLDTARNRELAELDERQRAVQAGQSTTSWIGASGEEQFDLNRHTGISLLADELRSLWRS